MAEFSHEITAAFSIANLVTMHDSPRDVAAELILGTFARHAQARRTIWSRVEEMGLTQEHHLERRAVIEVIMTIAQVTNLHILGTIFNGVRLYAVDQAASGAIVGADLQPVSEAVGAIDTAYPHSFRVEQNIDAFHLYNRRTEYVIAPLDESGMPVVQLTTL